ncbi:aminoacyl-tRNA hydrolase [Candidatus Acetothermia bacterium]|nr:aminoacyl-tRNA hydrolase [Candidatus Acetothermia bacterium]
MNTENSIYINETLSIPISELEFQFSRSSGPGGQNVNRTSTQVELYFDIVHSPSLSNEQKQRVLEVLRSHIDKDGVLHLTSQETRSQVRNRELVIERFAELLRQALRPRIKRKPTKPTKAANEERLKEKKQRKQSKQGRRKVISDW